MEMRELYHKEFQIRVYICQDNLYNINEISKGKDDMRWQFQKKKSFMC